MDFKKHFFLVNTPSKNGVIDHSLTPQSQKNTYHQKLSVDPYSHGNRSFQRGNSKSNLGAAMS